MKVDFSIDGCYTSGTVEIGSLRPGDTVYYNRRLAMKMVPPIGGGDKLVYLDYGDIVNLPESQHVFPAENIKVVKEDE